MAKPLYPTTTVESKLKRAPSRDADVLRIERAHGSPALLEREWLLTNGLGGFAMGTPVGANRRRYHGLLTAAAAPPGRRILALHSLFERIEIAGRAFEVSTQVFGGDRVLHAKGWQWQTAFELRSGSGEVRWEWTLPRGLGVVARTLRLVQGCNRAEIIYSLHEVAPPVKLRVRPLIALRAMHGQMTAPHGPQSSAQLPYHFEVRTAQDAVVTHQDLALELRAERGVWYPEAQWWHNFHYELDAMRGQNAREDVPSPAVAEWSVWSPAEREMRLTVELVSPVIAPQVESGRAKPQVATRAAVVLTNHDDQLLARAADQFVVTAVADGVAARSIIAGYPWFSDWGRDSMICIPGLLLEREQYDDAAEVLLMFARCLRNGLIPNTFDDGSGQPLFNTIDASLWFVHAAALTFPHCDADFQRELRDACREIIHAYRTGIDHGIHADPNDGLIVGGAEGKALTWMDAVRDGICFTPRRGKPVEINALWHRALRAMIEMSDDAKERSELQHEAERVAESFRRAFWWGDRHCLHDVLERDAHDVHGEWRSDGRIRPNQIFAVSLPDSPLTLEQQRGVVQVVRERLLTPYGLRTLDPDDPSYRARFEGDLHQRDSAYHQGTVWPWLLGPFCEAVLRTADDAPGAVAQAASEVLALTEPLLRDAGVDGRGCLGQLSEVYDADAPHHPSGCTAQAWSVAEVFRARRMAERVLSADDARYTS